MLEIRWDLRLNSSCGQRKSKETEKQKKYSRAGLVACLSAYEASQLWGLLVAQVQARVFAGTGFLFPNSSIRFLSRRSPVAGAKDASPGLIIELIAAARMENAEISRNEDYLPADPRLDVRVRLGDSTVRLFPGYVERPVEDVDRAHLVASVADDELIVTKGFGVSHLLQVLLGYSEFAIQHFASAWTQISEDGEEVPSLSTVEVEAAMALLASGTPLGTGIHRGTTPSP